MSKLVLVLTTYLRRFRQGLLMAQHWPRLGCQLLQSVVDHHDNLLQVS